MRRASCWAKKLTNGFNFIFIATRRITIGVIGIERINCIQRVLCRIA